MLLAPVNDAPGPIGVVKEPEVLAKTKTVPTVGLFKLMFILASDAQFVLKTVGLVGNIANTLLVVAPNEELAS